MSWSAKNHKPKKQVDRSEPIPAGVYLLGATWAEKKRERNFCKLNVTVLHGPMKGRTIFTIIPTNVEKAGSANIVYHFLRSMNRLDCEIDFDNPRSIASAFLNAPFKAKVSKKTNRKGDRVFTNYGLEIFLGRNECSKEELAVMREWKTKRDGVVAQDAAENFRDDGFGGGGSSSGQTDAFRDDFPADDFGDDEIPF